MQIKGLLKDDSAVSPVIGVILMVAITVILAAVIATFVLGLGDSVSNTTPQASFSTDYNAGENTGDSNGEDGKLTITHEGGDSIGADSLKVSGTPNDDDAWYNQSNAGVGQSGSVSAGSSVDVDVNDDSTVRVVYEGPSGDSSATLMTWKGPDA